MSPPRVSMLSKILVWDAFSLGSSHTCSTGYSPGEYVGGKSALRPYLNLSLVIVDEAGYLPITTEKAHLFFQFVSYRYEKSSTIITSNKSFADWQELFNDPVIASAILDRLLHHCRVVNIKGHSYRLQGRNITNKEGGAPMPPLIMEQL